MPKKNLQSLQKVIVIVGPTASGKSELAVKIAQKFNGGVISADSRQVYRGMDIGTGKITKKAMRGIPHWLLDVASPKRRFTVAQYKKLALEAIEKITRKQKITKKLTSNYFAGILRSPNLYKVDFLENFREKNGKIPIICGGTGFYIQAVVDGLTIPPVPPDWKLRKKLEKKSSEELFRILQKLDPRRAKIIDRNNPRRLIRAIEIVKKTGKPVPELKKTGPEFDVLMIGIKKSPEELKRRIKKRLLKRLRQGMISEVKRLRKSGISWKRLEEFGLEYRWIARYLQGKLSYNEMIEELQKDTEHYARRQMTWSKRDKRIRWIENFRETEGLVEKFLR